MDQSDPRKLLADIAKILNKLKISASDKQLEDVRSIFKISGEKLDRTYLIKWAKKLDVYDILMELLDVDK